MEFHAQIEEEWKVANIFLAKNCKLTLGTVFGPLEFTVTEIDMDHGTARCESGDIIVTLHRKGDEGYFYNGAHLHGTAECMVCLIVD